VQCGEAHDEIERLLTSSQPAASQVPDDAQRDAERWRFIRNFLLVDDIDVGESCKTLYSICINESTFDANMVGLSRRMSVDEAMDACIRAAAPSHTSAEDHDNG
jgi:hypothetical protein